jgi:dihydrofolate reductase
MRLRRPRRDAQSLPDLVVRETLCDQLDDLALPIGDLQLPLVQYLCHAADANNGPAGCTLAERRIRPEYARLVGMARLIYTALCSLDGFVADADGNFGWAKPDEEVHAFVNDLERPFGTHLYGRRLYEVLVAWETMDQRPDQPQVILDFARIWQAADKIVYSRTLEKVSSARTRIEREFDPDAVRELKTTAERDLLIGGPELAGEAIRAGLVDEYQLFLAPAIVGRGKRVLSDDVRLDLELLDERRFASGFVYLSYRKRS